MTVSDLALMDLKPTFGSVAHAGISPQRSSDSERVFFFGSSRTTGTGCEGAMLYRGSHSSSSSGKASKYSARICFRRERRERPHMRQLLQITDGGGVIEIRDLHPSLLSWHPTLLFWYRPKTAMAADDNRYASLPYIS